MRGGLCHRRAVPHTERVDGTRSGADLAQPVAHRGGGDLLRPARGGEWLEAQGEVRRQSRGVGATRAVGRPTGMPLPGIG